VIREVTVSGSTIEEAIKKGAEELGVSVESVSNEVITEPKKGFLGFGAVDAKVRVFYEITPAIKAKEFIEKVVSNMGIKCEIVETEKDDDGVEFVLEGESEELGILIGHHGDVLESLQYLSSLAANRGTDDFYRIGIDVNDYRKKREETLRALARKKASRVAKYKRSFVFEPMSARDRRIIHSELQDFEGVNTHSVGQDDERKVIISATNMNKPADKNARKPQGKRNFRNNHRNNNGNKNKSAE
jgi:spoIIIJ-associated protein